MKAKFLSRKFFITCTVIGIATSQLTGGDLAGVLIACISAYSLGNVGEYWFDKSDKSDTK